MARLISGAMTPDAMRYVRATKATKNPANKRTCEICGAVVKVESRLPGHLRKVHGLTSAQGNQATGGKPSSKGPARPVARNAVKRSAARTAGSTGLMNRPPVPPEVRAKVYARDRGRCQICGVQSVVAKISDPNPLARRLDHITLGRRAVATRWTTSRYFATVVTDVKAPSRDSFARSQSG